MLVDLIDFQNGKNEPDGARSVIGILIIMSVLPNPFSSLVQSQRKMLSDLMIYVVQDHEYRRILTGATWSE